VNRRRRMLTSLGPLGLLLSCSQPAPAHRATSTSSASPRADAGPDATAAPAATSTEPATSSTAAVTSPPAAVDTTVTTVTVTMPATTRAPRTTTTVEPFVLPERAEDSYSDIEWLIRQTFPETPDKAVRVARCESTLDPGAVSPDGANWGLMQINVVHKGLAASMGYSWAQMLQARPNLAVARAVYDRAGGWGPWSCA
jgi:hypothetical protein